MKKKYQVFISSTYTDLLGERQAAVEAVLRSKNIPAGMELFSAGSKSQLDTIKKWIDESDIYVLILGGRYGSLEDESQLSYTEIEYRYAIEIGKPFFAVVLSDEYLKNKVNILGSDALEMNNPDKLKKFKKVVKSKMCRICDDLTEIKLSVMESIMEIQSENDLEGWIKGNDVPNNSILLDEIEILRNEKNNLEKEIKSLETLTKKENKNSSIGAYSFEDIKKVLESKIIKMPASMHASGEDKVYTALDLFITTQGLLTSGITPFMSNDTQRFIVKNLVPTLMNFELVEKEKVKSTTMKSEYLKFHISPLGNKFLSLYEVNKLKNKSTAHNIG